MYGHQGGKEGSINWEVGIDVRALLALRVLNRFCMSDSLWRYGSAALQALLSVRFSRQKYWSGLSFPPPGDLPNPGIKPASLMSPALAGRFLPLIPPGKPIPFHPFYSTGSYSVLCGDLSGKEIQKTRIYGCIWASQVDWWSTVHGVAKSRTWLTWPNVHMYSCSWFTLLYGKN